MLNVQQWKQEKHSTVNGDWEVLKSYVYFNNEEQCDSLTSFIRNISQIVKFYSFSISFFVYFKNLHYNVQLIWIVKSCQMKKRVKKKKRERERDN